MSLHIKKLPKKPPSKEITSKQASFDLEIEAQTEIQGVGMGVLSDGTPFLTQRGLARLCGVQNAHIGTISSEWSETTQKPRITAIKDLMKARGADIARAHYEVFDSAQTIYAYPDSVCLAVLEYYAFEAGSNCKDEARANFRLLAGTALQEFIYTQVGYSPTYVIPVAWQQFHDRVTTTFGDIPPGYFSVFKEAADVIVSLIRAGADVGVHFIPDISIGQHWSKYWGENELDGAYGARQKYPHNYPDYFPQAPSNPQDVYCYPDLALAEFRTWMREAYLPERLPSYLGGKAKQGALPASFVKLALTAFQKEDD